MGPSRGHGKEERWRVRIAQDLTQLNPYVNLARYPLPRIKDILTNTVGAQFFSKLDLKRGYFQIPLHEDSRSLTTTITPLGLRRYKRMPMGLSDSASAFQSRVKTALQGLDGVEVYIDDIIVHGKTREEHDRRLIAVLQRLSDNGFRLQVKKVLIAKESVPAFGYILGKDGISPNPENVEAILEALPPKDVKGLQRFLGSVNYFHDLT